MTKSEKIEYEKLILKVGLCTASVEEEARLNELGRKRVEELKYPMDDTASFNYEWDFENSRIKKTKK